MAKGRNAVTAVRKFFPKVSKVVDATQAIEINVKNRDCNSAEVKNHNECAMAKACKRQLHIDGAVISVGTAYLVKGDTATRYRIPERISREIIAFDRNGGFMPGQYKLKNPTGRQRLGQNFGTKTGTKHPHRKSLRHFSTAGIRTTLHSAQPNVAVAAN